MSQYKAWAMASLLLIIYSVPASANQDRVPASAYETEYAPVQEKLKQCVVVVGGYDFGHDLWHNVLCPKLNLF